MKKKSNINFTQFVLLTLLIVISSFLVYAVISTRYELSNLQLLIRLVLTFIIISISGFLIEKMGNNDFIVKLGDKWNKN